MADGLQHIPVLSSTCAHCNGPLANCAPQTVILWSVTGPRKAEFVKRFCPPCRAYVYPQWISPANKNVAGRLPLRRRCALLDSPINAPTYVTNDMFIDDELLLHFGSLFCHGALTAKAMCDALQSNHGSDLPESAALTSSVLWRANELRLVRVAALHWHALGMLPAVAHSARVHPHLDLAVVLKQCDFATQQTYENVLGELLLLMQKRFLTVFVENHSQFCTEACKEVMLIDGNWKLRSKSCCVEVGSTQLPGTDIRTPLFCQRFRTTCYGTCSNPAHRSAGRQAREAVPADETAQVTQRTDPLSHEEIVLPENIVIPEEPAMCTSTRELARRPKDGCAGILAGIFIDCGLWCSFQRMHIAESRTQVMRFLQHARQANPKLRLVGYDAFCQLEQSLRTHRPSGLEGLQGFHDRWHLRTHVREVCHTDLSADIHRALWVWEAVTVTDEASLRKVEQQCCRKNSRTVLHRVEGCANPCLPAAVVRREALRLPLPILFTFMDASSSVSTVHPIHVTTEGGRQSLIRLVDRASLRLRTTVRRKGWHVPEGMYLHSLKSDSLTATEVCTVPQSCLFQEARQQIRNGSVNLTLRSPKNTSKLERRWVSLNRFSRTVSMLSGVRFEFHLLHVLAAQNIALAQKANRAHLITFP